MKFEIKHRFRQPPHVVVDAMFDPALGPRLTSDMETIVEIELLEKEENGDVLTTKTRYRPVPLIKRVGTKKIEPEMLEWIAEMEFDRGANRGTFRNVPVRPGVAKLLDNSGTIEMVATPDGGTERTLRGDLKVRVAFVGKLAEPLIKNNAVKILDEEGKVLQTFLDEA